MPEVQLPSGLWLPSAWEGKADRSQRASVAPGLTGDQVASHFRDYESFLNAIKIDWVYSCVSLIDYSFAANKWDLIDKEEDPLEDPSDTFLQLMERPNPVQSGFQFRELASAHLELTGNAYITLESRNGLGQPRECYLPSPSRMRIVPDPDNYIRGYVFDASGLGGGRRLIPYQPDEVIHIKWANPLDSYYGLGNIEAAQDLLEIVMDMAKQEKGYWRSGGRIIGTLQTDQTLTVDEFDQLTSDWARANRDDKQRARVAVLQKGLKFAPIAEGLRGLDLVNIEKAKRDRVLAVFGVPLPKLGIMEQAQYKQEDADRTFHGETMTPKFKRWEDGVQPLVDLFHPDREWRFERRNFEDDTSKLQNANTMASSGLFTIDEARVYFGADPLPKGNGDVLYVNSAYTVIPLGSLGELGAQNMEPPPAPDEPAVPLAPGQPEPPPPPPNKPPMVPGNAASVVDAALAASAPDDADIGPGKALSETETKQLADDLFRRQRLALAVSRERRTRNSSPLLRVKAFSGRAVHAAERTQRRAKVHPAIVKAAERGAAQARANAVKTFVPRLRDAFRAQQRRIVNPKRLSGILKAEDPVAALTAAWDAAPLRSVVSEVHKFAQAQGRQVATSLLPVGRKDDDQGWADLDFGERIAGIDEVTREAVAEQIREGLRRGYSPLQIAEGYADENYPGIAGVFDQAQDWRAECLPGWVEVSPAGIPEATSFATATARDAFFAKGVGHGIARDPQEGGGSVQRESRAVMVADGFRHGVIRPCPPTAAIVGAFRRRYDGPLIKITTSSGNELSGTPNHPVLTRKGWVALGAIVEGEDVFQRSLRRDDAEWQPEVHDVPTPIREVFDALSESGLLQRVAGLSVDFHGDGMDGDVDVVRTHRELGLRMESEGVESGGHGGLMSSGTDLPCASGLGSNGDGRRRLADVLGVVASKPEGAIVTNGHSVGSEDHAESLRGDVQAARQGAAWLARFVAPDRVLKVESRWFAGDVFNLDTVAGCYFAGNILTHNCIARTEAAQAYNEAANARYREGGVDQVLLLDGTEFDAECAERDGTVVGIDDVPEDHPNGTLTTAPYFPDEDGAAVDSGEE